MRTIPILIVLSMLSAALHGCGGGGSSVSSSGDYDIDSLQCGSGDGSNGRPYVLCSSADIYNIRNDLAATYALKQDADLSDYTEWPSIGTRSAPFTGRLDGHGHKITGLSANRSSDLDYTGLFGYINGGAVRNMGVEISLSGLGGRNYVGGIAGRIANTEITNCYVTGNITARNSSGGVVGNASGSIIRNTHSSGNITASGLTGGIAGNISNGTSITDSYSVSNINSQNYAGGIAGESLNSSITNCYASGTVTGTDTSSTRMGGIVGYASNSTIKTNAALNGSLTGIRLTGRIAGEFVSGTANNNLALNMPVWGTQQYGINGAAITMNDARKKATYTALGWQFGQSDDAPWVIQDNTEFPRLYYLP